MLFFDIHIVSIVSSVSARKLKCPSSARLDSARNLYSSSLLESENISSNPSLVNKLLISPKQGFFSLSVEKVNNDKSSSQNIVISSQNNVLEDMNKSIALQKFWIFSSYFSVGFTENNLLLSLTACVDLWASETFLTNRKWTGNAPIRNSTSTKWLSWRTSFTSNPSEQYRKSLQVCIYLIHSTFNYSYDDLTNFFALQIRSHSGEKIKNFINEYVKQFIRYFIF